MDAATSPVRRPSKELHTGDIGHEKKPDFTSRDDLDTTIVLADGALHKDQAEALAFNEEPVTIRIERSSEKFAPSRIECWVNGKGAEVLVNGRWLEMTWIPVGVPVTIKRKYVEVLAKSKIDSVNTRVEQHSDREENIIERHTSSRAPFSVLEDKNPKGVAWLTQLVRFG